MTDDRDGSDSVIEIRPGVNRARAIEAHDRRDEIVELLQTRGLSVERRKTGAFLDRLAKMQKAVDSGLLTWDEIVSVMDDEELARGQLRDVDGHLAAAGPKFLPSGFLRAVDSEVLNRGAITYKTAYPKVVKTLVRIAEYGEKDSDRLNAIRMILERVEGKIPERVVVSGAGAVETTEDIIVGVVAEVDNTQVVCHDYSRREQAVPDEEE